MAEARPGFFATWKQVLLAPTELAGRAPAERSRLPPLLFAIVVGAVELAFGVIWPFALMGGAWPLGVALGAVLLSPLLTVAGVGAEAGLVHLALIVVGAPRRPFRDTFDLCCFAQAPRLLAVVPLVGGAVGGVWSIVA